MRSVMNAKSAVTVGAFLATFAIMGSAQASHPVKNPHHHPAQHATAATCGMSLRDAVLHTEARADHEAHCKVLAAEHNVKALTGQIAHLTGNALHEAHEKLAAWEHAHVHALFTAGHDELAHAQGLLARATGSAKADIEANIAAAKAKINGAIASAEAHVDGIAGQVTTIINTKLAAAKAKAEQLKHSFETGAANVKEKLEGEWLMAKHAVGHLEEMFHHANLQTAEKKLAAVMNHLGADAEALKARAKAALETAKHTFESVKARIAGEVHAITSRVAGIEAKLKHKFTDLRDHLTDVGKHITDHLNKAGHALAHVGGSIMHGLKSLFG